MTLEFENRRITLEDGRAAALGVVLLTGGADESLSLRAALDACGAPDCRLAACEPVDWDADYSPWRASLGESREFSGCADEFLPVVDAAARALMEGGSPRVYLVGYSMGGLASLYFQTKLRLDGCASCSGSLWYPDFLDYLEKNPPSGAVYLSLGGKEKNTRDELMSTVEDRTLAAKRICEKSAARVVFNHEPGGHFRDVDGRLCRAIAWLLK